MLNENIKPLKKCFVILLAYSLGEKFPQLEQRCGWKHELLTLDAAYANRDSMNQMFQYISGGTCTARYAVRMEK